MPRKPRTKDSHGTAAGVEGKVVDRAEEPRAREGWQRPPFEPGNGLAVTHGAFSPTEIEKAAEEVWPAILEQLITQMPGFMPVDNLIVSQLRKVSGQIFLMERHLEKVGLLSADGDLPKFMWYLDKAYRHRLELCKTLGMGAAIRSQIFGNTMSGQRAAAEAAEATRRLQEREQARRKRR